MVPPAGFDRAIFEQRSEAGRRAVADGDDRRASELYGSALEIWRGPALSDVRAGPLISAHLVGLNETRRGVLDQRIEADLRLGRHRELLGELRALTQAHRTDENAHAQFMLALHRSGRKRHALKVFRRLNRLLSEELGIEPSPRIQSLGWAIRSADPVLDLRPANLAGTGALTRSPADEPEHQHHPTTNPHRVALPGQAGLAGAWP
jgi:DNA-binding SARP family transcriptional activator